MTFLTTISYLFFIPNIICRDGETADYCLQTNIDDIENEKFRTDYARKIQPTIDRFKAKDSEISYSKVDYC